jgi:hypothetical protein
MILRTSIVFLALLTSVLPFVGGCDRPSYQTEGDLLAVDGGTATIAADAIPGVLERSTARLPARPPSLLDGALPGTRVRFRVVRDGAALALVGIEPIGEAHGTSPSVHDHGPRHGGVVREVEGIHVEMVATPDGRIRIYSSDAWRRPLPADGATATVKLRLPSGDRTLELAPAGDALEARTTPFDADTALAEVTITRAAVRRDMSVLLDLTGERAGVAVAPRTTCVPPAGVVPGARGPRCVIGFGGGFTAIATTPDGARAIVAVSHAPTSVWDLPAATIAMGIEPLPPIVVPGGVHEPDARAIVVRSDGAEIAVAAGPTLFFYDAASGRYRRKVDGPGGAIRALAWSPDGACLLVAAAGDGNAHLLDARDGRVVRTLAGSGQAQAVAFDADGGLAAVATGEGTILLADPAGASAPRVLTPSSQGLTVVAFTPDRLLAAGDDGVLHVLDRTSGAETARSEIGAAVRLLAVARDGRHVATADAERVLRVHRLPDGAVVETLPFHQATISVLAWGAGPTLVSGDNDATLAVWDMPAAR